MHFFSWRTCTLSVIAAVFLCGGNYGYTVNTTQTPDELANLPELSLPITDKKLVIAHCMPNIIRYKGHKLEDSCNPDYFSPSGNITAPIGGLTQVKVLSDSLLSNASLDEAVEFDLEAAIQSGIDGFQFYYTLGNDSWDEIIKAYLRVAGKKHLDFKFTFCISHPSGGSETERITGFAKRMNVILDEAGRNNPHWLRTPDGRLILYTWYGDGLADIPKELNDKPAQYYIARAYKKLGDAIKEKLACMISINEQIGKDKLNHYLDYFPAVWLWTLPYTDNFIGNMVASECKRRGRTFTGSAFPGFYTSKLLKRGTWDMFHFAGDAVKAGIGAVERKYIVTGLSYNFRKQFEFAISKDVPVMNIITWNDYPEGHHFAPEANHNDGFSILLKYYKSVWKKEKSADAGRDIIITFYKKYKHTAEPSPFNIPVVEIEKAGVPVKVEDSVEVITLLKEKAKLVMNNGREDVPAGMHVSKFAAIPGKVVISLKRNGKETERLECPEWITDKPYRTDRLTYSFSNLTRDYYKKLFGGTTIPVLAEYNAEEENHIHYYKSK